MSAAAPPPRRRRVTWSLALQLRVGFAMALALALAVFAAAWWVAQEYRRDVDIAYGEELRTAVQLAEAESALWQLRYDFPEFMVADAEEQRRILGEQDRWYAVVEERLDAYTETARDGDAKRALTDLRSAYWRYKDTRPKFFELWLAGEKDQAIAWRALTSTPFGAQTATAFATQITLQRSIAQRAQAESERKARLALGLVTAIAIALLAMLVGGYIYLARMLRPIRALQARSVRTVEEMLDIRLEVAGGNEVTSLVESVERMSAAFASHAGEIAKSQEDLLRLNADLERRVSDRTEALGRSLADLEQQNRDAALLAELSGLLQSCHSVEEAGEIIGRYCAKAYPGAPGAVYLFQPSRNYLDRLAGWGDPLPAASFAPEGCWALRRGRAHRPRGDDLALACAHARAQAGEALCIPLNAQEGAIGLLHLEAGAQAEKTAQPMAEQLALALANLRLRQTLRDQSIRDALTGLHNRRYLEESLVREIAAAKRAGRELAVFMLDADHFKRFNDQHGHEAGDAVLRAIGRLLKGAVRASDLACRFGGEEFTVVLIGCDLKSAREWAGRLAADTRRLEVKHAGKSLPQVTLSMGLALYPGNGEDPESLLQSADLALYEAKHAGRDRLAVALAPGVLQANGA